MEPFKIALKIAIDQQADKISFVEGRLPVMWKSDKEIAINHQPIVQKVLLSQLFACFFPSHQAKLVEGQPVQGPLKVVDVGNLILLAIPGKPSSLNVYFPGSGEQYFADDWRSLARVRNADHDAPPPVNLGSQSQSQPQTQVPPTAPQQGSQTVPPPPPVSPSDFKITGIAPPPPPPDRSMSPPRLVPDQPTHEDGPVSQLDSMSTSPKPADQPAFSVATDPSAPNIPATEAPPQNAATSSHEQAATSSHEQATTKSQEQATTKSHEQGSEVEPVDPNASITAITEQLPSTSDPNINFSQSQLRGLADSRPASLAPADKPAEDRFASTQGYAAQPGSSHHHPAIEQGFGEHSSAEHSKEFQSQSQHFAKNELLKTRSRGEPKAAESTAVREPKVRKPLAILAKDIHGLIELMAEQGYDQLVLSRDQKAAFFDREGMVLSETALTQALVDAALEKLFPESLSDSKQDSDFFRRWHKSVSGEGFRIHGSFGNGNPWLSIVKKPNPLSLSSSELMIPEGILDLAWLDRGLVILAGEQNCGKSTTAHHLVDRINRHRNRNILIVQNEDAAPHRADKSCIRKQCTARWTKQSSAPWSLDQDPADTVIVDGGFQSFLVEPVLKAVNQGKLVFWVLPGQSGGEALFDVLRFLDGTSQLYLAAKLLGRLEAVVSQTILHSHDHQRVPVFEAWHFGDRHRRWLKEQWQHNVTGGEVSLFELLGPANASPGISFEKSILNALALGSISPAEVRKQFFDKERVDKLFADAGISTLAASDNLFGHGSSLEAS